MQKIASVSLICFLMACGQRPDTKIHQQISNTRTSRHINIPGTRLYIIPPPGFNVSGTFSGLQKTDKALINVYDLVGGSFYSNAATFNKAEFGKKGVKVFDYKDITVDGYPAKYISMQGEADAMEYALVFGDSTFSTMVMAVYPAKDPATGKQLISALNTIAYDKDKKTDPFETANFSLDNTVSRFGFFRYSSNMYIYTEGGKDNSDDTTAPVVIVTQLPKDSTMTGKDVGDMMINKMQEYGFVDMEIRDVSTAPINSYPAYTVTVSGKIRGQNTILYECVVTHGDKAIAIQGIAKHDIEANINEFAKLSHSVQVK